MNAPIRKRFGLPWLNVTVLGIVLAVAMGAIFISITERKPSGPKGVEVASTPSQDPPGTSADDETNFEVIQEVTVSTGSPIGGPPPGPVPVPLRPDTPLYVFNWPHMAAVSEGNQTFGNQHKLAIEAKIQQLFPQNIPALKIIAAKHADRDNYLRQNNKRVRSPGFFWHIDAHRVVVENGSAYVVLLASRGTDDPELAKTGDIMDGMIYEKWKLDPVTAPPTLVTRSLDLTPLWQELKIVRY
ncbi:MAG: hypothetical protein WCI02_14745 [Planctomycetota bacterium]